MKQQRIVEVYVVRSLGGSDSGDWWTVLQYVDAALPREEAIKEAIAMMWADLYETGNPNDFVDVQLYHYDEEPCEED